MMRAVALVCLLASAAAAPGSLLSRVQQGKKTTACSAESQRLKGKEPEPSRGAACETCFSFSDGFKGMKYVSPNKHMCAKCYSMVSSCDDKKFAWACYDEHEQFANMEKNGHNPDYDEAKEMAEFFKNKEPEKCKA